MSSEKRATVYYNSACPVCDAGICALREQIDPEEVTWVDVHTHPERLMPLGLDLETVRERLHVVDVKGHMHVGADAIGYSLSLAPRWRWLSAPMRWRLTRGPSRMAYNAFAALLYRWNRFRGLW